MFTSSCMFLSAKSHGYASLPSFLKKEMIPTYSISMDIKFVHSSEIQIERAELTDATVLQPIMIKIDEQSQALSI